VVAVVEVVFGVAVVEVVFGVLVVGVEKLGGLYIGGVTLMLLISIIVGEM
jgi:hypothetical protein